jgi:hypothetical protein
MEIVMGEKKIWEFAKKYDIIGFQNPCSKFNFHEEKSKCEISLSSRRKRSLQRLGIRPAK